jgi:hypothetical protein
MNRYLVRSGDMQCDGPRWCLSTGVRVAGVGQLVSRSRACSRRKRFESGRLGKSRREGSVKKCRLERRRRARLEWAAAARSAPAAPDRSMRP